MEPITMKVTSRQPSYAVMLASRSVATRIALTAATKLDGQERQLRLVHPCPGRSAAHALDVDRVDLSGHSEVLLLLHRYLAGQCPEVKDDNGPVLTHH